MYNMFKDWTEKRDISVLGRSLTACTFYLYQGAYVIKLENHIYGGERVYWPKGRAKTFTGIE